MKKNNLISSFFHVLMDEFKKSEGCNKFLILAIAVNLPLPWVFIPYGTQTITVVLLIFFIRQFVKVERLKMDDKKIINTHLLLLLPSIVGIFAQVFWLPYITQLYSVILIGAQYILTLKKHPL